jgi:hypothetical protein
MICASSSIAADGLIEHNVVVQRVGADDVVIVGISGPPDEARRAIPRAGNGFELHRDEAVLDAAVVLEQERVGSAAGLPGDLGSRRRLLVLFDRPFRIARARARCCPALGAAPTASVSNLAVLSAMAVTSIRQMRVAAMRIRFILASLYRSLVIAQTSLPTRPKQKRPDDTRLTGNLLAHKRRQDVVGNDLYFPLR